MASYDHRVLLAWHQDSGKTLEQVCVLAQVSYPYLRSLRNGVRGRPSIEVLTRIAAAYGRDVRELFTDDATKAGAR